MKFEMKLTKKEQKIVDEGRKEMIKTDKGFWEKAGKQLGVCFIISVVLGILISYIII